MSHGAARRDTSVGAAGTETRRAMRCAKVEHEGRPAMSKTFLCVTIMLAMAACAAGEAPGTGLPGGSMVRGGKGSAEGLPKNVKPLCDMSAADRYKGEDGGLYGGGRNEPPEAHWNAALAESKRIEPRDKDGKPAADGKVGLVSIGFSNTTMEFQKFLQLLRGLTLPPTLAVVDGAIGGRDAPMWAENRGPNPQAPKPWDVLMSRLDAAGLAPAQVQAIWMKMVLAGPDRYGEFPKQVQVYKDSMVKVLQQVKKTFPNVRIVYLSTRIYGGYAGGGSPEPFAYETGFCVRSLILDQFKGDAALNYDAAKGEVKAPLLLWGPYTWANGAASRKDGLAWEATDYQPDRLHPDPASGQEKVARRLLEFLQTSETSKAWFGGK